MFVTANALKFSSLGLQSLQTNDEVQISSGMGGSYTLKVVSVGTKYIKTKGVRNCPVYLASSEYTFDEALEEFYLLMPVASFGVTKQHIKIANKAGFHNKEDLISIVAKVAETYDCVVSSFIDGMN